MSHFLNTFDLSDTSLIQHEPALVLDIPVVRNQSALRRINKGKLAFVESHIARAYQHHRNHLKGGFGPSYQLLIQEFQPLLHWADTSWDYLLYTEGCRFIPRQSDPITLHRSGYRAYSQRDYRRLVQQVFRDCLIRFSQKHEIPSFAPWVRHHFWPMLLVRYRALANPADARQRPLSGFSYLRCIPYTFLNPLHETLVNRAIESLPLHLRRTIELYYFNFFTLPATAAELGIKEQECANRFTDALLEIAAADPLVYCLLKQIERY